MNANANPNADEHADALIAAYALGALDPEDRSQVEALLASSQARQEELRQFREVVSLLPFAAVPADPPAHIREQLFARIEADRATLPTPQQAPVRPAKHSFGSRMRSALMASLAVLTIALGGFAWFLGNSVARLDQTNRELVATMSDLQQSLAATQSRQEALAAQLSESQRQLAVVSDQLAAGEDQINQLSAQLARDEFVISFVSAPGVATRALAPSDGVVDARGEMYMYPGETNAVVLFSGLPDLAPGQVYQFWLADGDTQVAGGIFEVDATGIARLLVDAPREVNAFREVMVTVEPAGGSTTPSEQVVLAGSL